MQNYPNPFNPQTTIRYTIHRTSYVTLTIFDLLGRKIQTIVESIEQPGTKSVLCSGEGLPSGVYFYKLQAHPIANPGHSTVQLRKMLLVR